MGYFWVIGLFFGKKTLDQCLGANLKNPFFFAQFYSKFATFLTILTSVWGAQHPNGGQNIQQVVFLSIKYVCIPHEKDTQSSAVLNSAVVMS